MVSLHRAIDYTSKTSWMHKGSSQRSGESYGMQKTEGDYNNTEGTDSGSAYGESRAEKEDRLALRNTVADEFKKRRRMNGGAPVIVSRNNEAVNENPGSAYGESRAEKEDRLALRNTVADEFKKRRRMNGGAPVIVSRNNEAINENPDDFPRIQKASNKKISNLTLTKRETVRRMIFDALKTNLFPVVTDEDRISELSSNMELEIFDMAKITTVYNHKSSIKVMEIKNMTKTNKMVEI
uniref:Non-structural maintenance of chromosomes element 4 n=1 Tax=Steinernema glaseri TaxID=37863 RepID=A0A1I7ZP85_9BILA